MNRAVLAVGGAVVLLLGGCSSTAGPAEMATTDGHTCYRLAVGDDMLVGDFIKVPEGVEIVLHSVSFDDPQNVEVLETWVSRDMSEPYGGSTFPPESNGTWDSRETVDGAHLGGGYADVMIHVKRTGDPATTGAIAVEYASDGVSHRVVSKLTIDFRDSCFDEE